MIADTREDLIQFQVEHTRDVLRRVVPEEFHNRQPSTPVVAEWAVRFSNNPKDAGSVMLCGPIGTGKTSEAFAAIWQIAETMAATGRRLRWRYTTHPDLNDSLMPKPDGSNAYALTPFLDVDLLLLDDLGAGKQGDWTGSGLLRLVDHRRRKGLATIYTTNLLADELRTAATERVVSRMGGVRIVPMVGADRRWAAA